MISWDLNREKIKKLETLKKARKIKLFQVSPKNIEIISTQLLARLGWFCPVVSEPVKPYFTRFLRVLTFCLGASKIVIFCENGVVNGVVKIEK